MARDASNVQVTYLGQDSNVARYAYKGALAKWPPPYDAGELIAPGASRPTLPCGVNEMA